MANSHVKVLARYYRDCARRGVWYGRNLKSVAQMLGMTHAEARIAQKVLTDTGRLKITWNASHSIDGMAFGKPNGGVDGAAKLTRRLQRAFSPVYDARIKDDPENVPKGPPQQIVVGNARLDAAYAYALALIVAPQSKMRAA